MEKGVTALLELIDVSDLTAFKGVEFDDAKKKRMEKVGLLGKLAVQKTPATNPIQMLVAVVEAMSTQLLGGGLLLHLLDTIVEPEQKKLQQYNKEKKKWDSKKKRKRRSSAPPLVEPVSPKLVGWDKLMDTVARFMKINTVLTPILNGSSEAHPLSLEKLYFVIHEYSKYEYFLARKTKKGDTLLEAVLGKLFTLHKDSYYLLTNVTWKEEWDVKDHDQEWWNDTWEEEEDSW